MTYTDSLMQICCENGTLLAYPAYVRLNPVSSLLFQAAFRA